MPRFLIFQNELDTSFHRPVLLIASVALFSENYKRFVALTALPDILSFFFVPLNLCNFLGKIFQKQFAISYFLRLTAEVLLKVNQAGFVPKARLAPHSLFLAWCLQPLHQADSFYEIGIL